MTPHLGNNRTHGFSLAELLITLAIVAGIAVFTIPKLLQISASNYNTNGHEVQKMIVQAYTRYRLNDNTPTASFNAGYLTPYLDYVKITTVGVIDEEPLYAQTDCSAATCLQLKNGGILWFHSWISFGGTGSTNGVFLLFDPNPNKSAGAGVTANGPEKAVEFYLYYDGRVLPTASMMPNTYYFNGVTSNEDDPNPARAPEWWSD